MKQLLHTITGGSLLEANKQLILLLFGLFVFFTGGEKTTAQSNHTVSFSGSSGDFNAAERISAAGNSTDYYLTFDGSYFYIGAFRTSGNFGGSDNLAIYIDTDPNSTPTGGTGVNSGQSYNNVTGSLPFSANYNVHVEESYQEARSFGSSWASTISGVTYDTGSTWREVKIPFSSIGSPDALYLTMWMGYNGGFFSNIPGTDIGASSNPTIVGYFGGIGVSSPDCIPVNITNTAITGTVTNTAPASGAVVGKLVISSNTTASSDNFTIASGGSIQLSGTAVLDISGRSITMGGGSVGDGRGTTINIAGTATITTTSGNTFTFNGEGNWTGNPYSCLGTISINRKFTPIASGGLTVEGTLDLHVNSYLNSNAPTYGTSSTLLYNTGTSYGRAIEWSATSGAGYPNNIQISNSTSLDVGNSAVGVLKQIAGNLTIDSGCGFYMDFGSNDMTQPVVIGGDINIAGGLSLSDSNDGDLKVRGNWTHTSGTFAPKSRIVFFDAAIGNQTITATGGETFDNCIVDKAAGNVILANDAVFNQALTLTSGLISTVANIVIISSTGSISRSSGYVSGNLQKYIPTGTNSIAFEIGDASNYTPVTTAYASVTTGGNNIISTTSNDHSSISGSGIDGSKSVNRYYSITNNGATGGTYSPTFTFVAGDVDGGAATSNFVVRRYASSTWNTTTVGTRTSTTTQATGLSSYGDFQIGEANTITVATDPSSDTVCTGTGTSFSSTSSSTPTPTVKWQRGISGVYTDVDGTIDSGVYSGFTTGTLVISNSTGLNGYTYRSVFTNINGSATSSAATLTVNVNTAGAGSSTPTLCINTALTSITHTTTGATGIGTSTGLPSGVSAGWSSSTITISGTPTAAGVFNYSIPLTGGCGSIYATGTITVTAEPNAGTLSGTQGICSTGTITFSSDGDVGGIWTSSDLGVATIGSSTGIITAVGAGVATMTFTISGTGGCADDTATRDVTVTTAPNAGTLSGTQGVCLDSTTTFASDGDTGTWSSGNTGVVTINASGIIMPVSVGTATITYTVTGTGGCSNATATRTVTVTAVPNAGTLSGTQAICSNGTTTFSSTVGGGAWTSGSTGVATINSSTGVITPVGAGTSTITYTITGTGGCIDDTETRDVTVTTAPNAGTLSCTQAICSNGTTTFISNGDTGGSWTSSDAAVATIGALTGVITPVGAGTATMTYTVTGAGGCIDDTETRDVTVTTAPNAGTLSGTQAVCSNSTTTFSTDGDVGIWSSGNTGIATINSTTGVITPVSAGTATITYTVTGTGGCSNATATRTVTVTTAPNAGSLSGTQAVCSTGTTTFNSNGNSGGAWTSSDEAVATINSTTGVITPVGAGTSTITYTITGTGGCSNATATRDATVTTAPNAGTLSGIQGVCLNDSTTFASDGDTGTWSSGNTGVVTINASGIIMPVSVGTATITFTVTGTGGCSNATATRTVTVTAVPNAGTLSGTQAICSTGTTTFSSNGDTGGSWTSSDAAVATIGALTGVITPVGAGTATMTYTITGTGGCIDDAETRDVTVTTAPNAGTLSGTQAICSTGTTTFSSNGNTGGAWSSSDENIAIVDSSTGEITAVGAGTATITYTITGTGGCSNATAIRTLTVTAAPDAGTLSGTEAVCSNSTTTFSSDGDSGTWSSGNTGIATINSTTGVIAPVGAGTATVTYTVTGTGGCSNAIATRTVTVTTAPNAGSLSGTQAICSNGTVTFSSNGNTGGGWTSSDEAVATIHASTGVITPVGAGTSTITYTVTGTGGCSDATATRDVTITTAANAGTLSGTQAICSTGTTTFSSDGNLGGAWNSSNENIAVVDSSIGEISAVGAGITTITYTIIGTGGCSNAIATTTVTVTATPDAGTLSGTQAVCSNSTATFSSDGDSGTWSSDNTGVATINPSTGVITPVSVGTATMTYTVTGTGGCSDATATRGVTVTAAPNAGFLSGTQAICSTGTTTFSSNGDSGGEWSTSDEAVAIVDSSTGVIAPVAAGTATITYTVTGTGGCSNATVTRTIIVTAAADAGTLSGIEEVCSNDTTTFTSDGDTGTWSSGNTGVATINASGIITPVSVGTATITYIVIGTGGCSNATATRDVTVTALPNAGNLSGTQAVCIGSTTTFVSDGVAGGAWTSDNEGIATINALTGVITGVGAGTATMTYTVTGTGGCSDVMATRDVTVSPASDAGTVSANATICSGNATVVSLINYTGTIQWQQSLTGTSGWADVVDGVGETTDSYTTADLTVITYFRAIVTSGVCSSVESATITIAVDSVNYWTGASGTSWSDAGNWSCGVPNASTEAIINLEANQPIITSNAYVNSITLITGTTLTINSTYNLTVGDFVANVGTLTIKNNANLIQTGIVNNNTGAGTTIVHRNSAVLLRQDYTLWSSPVVGQRLQSFSPSTLPTRFYTYSPSSNIYVAENPNNNFAKGKGYLIRIANNHPGLMVWPGTFRGVLNNGTVTLPVTNNTFNAIGNPYPSTIDADAFINENNISEALYFWRKANNATTTSYATYTLAGGTGTSSNLSDPFSPADPLGLVPNGTIQVGQGFIAKSTSTSFVFKNSMRIADNRNQFLRQTVVERNRIWLNLTSTSGVFSQTMVAYMTDATAGIDPKIDGRYYNDSATALTSIISNEEFAIQGKALPFDTTDVVPLGFKCQLAGTFKISIDHMDGLFIAGQTVFLKDNLRHTIHNLSTGSYSFSSNAGVFNNRFEIVYKMSAITVKMNIEGYYDANTHAMRPVMANQGVGTSSTDVDTVRVELRDASTHALVAATDAMLQTNGYADAKFSSEPVGSYYIVVRHRNSIETWSAAPQTVGGTVMSYDFTDGSGKAYGHNMKEVAANVWAIYSGDLNQDGFIEGSDYPLLFNDSDNFAEGYYTTDLNGDGFVEGSDYPILFNNSDQFVEVIRPE